MKKKLASLFLLLALTGCTHESTARRVLEDNGYTDIKITGYRFMMCGKDDSFSTGFEATSPAKKRVTGAVCEGWTKGATIRFD
jgi:hypothetical protein